MNKRLFLLFIVTALLAACEQAPEPSPLDLRAALGGEAGAGFERAVKPRNFRFPQDHAAHPGFRNEWWYVTGNLKDNHGHHYGYQVTLFRIALSPQRPDSESQWASNQVWMAHVALTDVHLQQHWHAQRLSRGALELAGQSTQPFRVWLEDWQITGDEDGSFPWAIDVKTEHFNLQLQLHNTKPIVLQGDNGLSQKSSEAGNASYYYSMTRLQTNGTVERDGKQLSVSGWSWLDREWSTSALGEDQVGWDWFSLQLEDQQELMFYQLRQQDGSPDPHSSGKWIKPDGGSLALTQKDVNLKPLRYWKAESGRKYPVVWSLKLPSKNKSWRIEAMLDDQEMATGIHYWEGSVKVVDATTDKIIGYGYLEMTGY